MAEAFSDLAGHPALDLVNTVSWRLEPELSSDRLIDYSAVLVWCRQFDVLTEHEATRLRREAGARPADAAAVHDESVMLRDAVYAVVTDAPPRRAEQAREAITAAYAASLTPAALAPAGERLAWKDKELSMRTPLHRLARLAVTLLTQASLAAVRQCADKGCGYVYLDTSPRRNRRWCSAADCGNRNRVRRHYEKTRRQT